MYVNICKYLSQNIKDSLFCAVNQNIRSKTMAEEFHVEKSLNNDNQDPSEKKVIDEANYRVFRSKEKGPTAVGKGGDSLFVNIKATSEQLAELLEETQTVQDWVQRETSNNVAISCLDNENLKELYYEMKDGFGEYGPMSLMGFKTPQGVEIPRLKLYDSNGEVIEVLTGPMAIDELNKRALAYRSSVHEYSGVAADTDSEGMIQDYSGNPDDYV